MALVLEVDSAYNDVQALLLALGRAGIPVRVIDSAGLIGTWAEVLAQGNTTDNTGANNPTIQANDSLDFGAVGNIDAGATALRIGVGGNPRVLFFAGEVRLQVSLLRFTDTAVPQIGQTGTDGNDMTVQAQAGDGATPGGDMACVGGDNATAVNAGNWIGRGGVSTSGTDGQAFLQHANGTIAVRVQGTPGGVHPGNNAINVDQNGLAFFNGTTVTQPSITGSKGGNAALASLLTALNDMGLVTDNTT